MLIENGVVNPALIFFMRDCGVNVGDESPVAVSDWLQKEWVKTKDGGFRAEIGGENPDAYQLEKLSDLGFVDEIPINHDGQYEGTIVLGATLKSVTRRMWFVVREKFRSTGLHPEGFFRPIYLLGSSRPLDPKTEMEEHVPGIIQEICAPLMGWKGLQGMGKWPKTEIDMMASVAEWLSVSGVHPFIASDGVKPDGSPRPANTDETIRGFFSDDFISPGHYLLVSSQPACDNQLLAARRVASSIGEDITFDVAGPAGPAMPLARWLDTVAKQLWEEVQLLKKP